MQAGVAISKLLAYHLPVFGFSYIIQLFNGIRKGKLSNCSGLRTLFEYRLASSLMKIIAANAIKPVLYSIGVKKGSKKTQKTALKAQKTILVSGLLNPCLTESPAAEFFRSHANRMAVWFSTTSQ